MKPKTRPIISDSDLEEMARELSHELGMAVCSGKNCGSLSMYKEAFKNLAEIGYWIGRSDALDRGPVMGSIETAPRDGSLFLAQNSRNNVFAVVGLTMLDVETGIDDVVGSVVWSDAGGMNAPINNQWNLNYFDKWTPLPK
jgi:hypothetical protein